MHVGIVIPTLHGGGAEFAARQWIAELSSQGHEVTVYLYARVQPPVTLPPAVRVRCFAPRQLQVRSVTLPLWLRRQITTDHPDVVLSLLMYSNVATLLALTVIRKSAVPLLISERNMPSLHARVARRRDRITYRLARHLYCRATGVLALSHPVAGELVSAFRVATDRIFVVANPVVSSPVQVKSPSRAVEPQRLHIVCVGRQAEQKRPRLFVAVLRELAQRDISVRGTVIGDGPLRALTERDSFDSGLDIVFTGWKEPWWNAASDIDCILHTAQFEGLANVLVEAAAAGIPAVASSRALGVADAIVPGVTGELTLTDSPRDYADAVLRATSRPLPSDDTLRRWLEHLSIQASTVALLAALQAAIDTARA